MPHINLIYPFIPESQFDEGATQLTQSFSTFSPFVVDFSKFGCFEQGKYCVLFADPESTPLTSIKQVESVCRQLWPITAQDRTGFRPHLTLGQFPSLKATQSKITEFGKSWKAFQFEVNEIYMISRSGDSPFEILRKIPLGGLKSGRIARPIPNLPREDTTNFTTILRGQSHIVDRVTKWINRPGNTFLPRDIDKLKKSIAPMCLELLNLDREYIVALLKAGEYIEINGENVSISPAANNIIGDFEEYGYSEVALQVLKKVQRWLTTCVNPPKSIEKFKNCVNQLSTFQKDFPPEIVIQALVDQNVLRIEGNQVYYL